MKNLLILFSFAISTITFAQKGAQFNWINDKYEFGNIQQGVPVQCRFEFEIVGDAPIIIADVAKTCGCT